jgi:hypothetical protein
MYVNAPAMGQASYSVGSWICFDPSVAARGGATVLLGTMPLLFWSLWEWCFYDEGGSTKSQITSIRMKCFLTSAGAFFMAVGNWYKFSFSGPVPEEAMFGNWVVVYGSSMLAFSKFWSAVDYYSVDNKPLKSPLTDFLVGVGMAITAVACLIASIKTDEDEWYIYLTSAACVCFLLAAATTAYFHYYITY